MKLVFFSFFLLLPLAGCDDPDARKNLAQCELSPSARTATGDLYPGYMTTCMQSKGYVEDENLTGPRNAKCRDILNSDEEASCYRPDNWFEKWLASI
jgi:hypothetical protein